MLALLPAVTRMLPMFSLRYLSAAALLFALASILCAQQGAVEDPGPPPNLVRIKDDLYITATIPAALPSWRPWRNKLISADDRNNMLRAANQI
jgi:hypothetical protein